MTDLLLAIISLAASMAALIHSLVVINVMSRCTSHYVRLMYCVLATSSFASLSYLMAGKVVTVHGTIFTVVIAAVCLVDRRRVACECQRRAHHRATRHTHA